MSNTPGENGEESIENYNYKKSTNIKKFASSFIKEQTTGENQNKKNHFLNGIYGSDNINSELKTKLEKHLEKDESGEFEGVEIGDINISDLKKSSYKEYLYIKNKREKLSTIFDKNFNLSNTTQKKEIFSKINDLDEIELENLISSDLERSKLLEKIFGSAKKPVKKDLLKFLKDFKLENTYGNLSDKEKDLITGLYYKIEKGYDLDVNDLDILLLFSTEQKKEIVSTFCPVLSLKKALNYKIIDETEANDIKDSLLKEYLKKDGLEVDVVEYEKIFDSLDDEEININTDKYLTDGNVNEILLENTYFIRDEYNKTINKVKEEEKGNFTKESFYNELEKTQKFLKEGNIDKNNYDNSGNILVLNRSYESGEETVQGFIFMEILSIDFDNGFIEYSDKGIDKYNGNLGGKLEKMSLNDFLQLINVKNDTKDKTTIDSFNFISNDTLIRRLRDGIYEEVILSGGESELQKEFINKKQELEILIKKTKKYNSFVEGSNEQNEWLNKMIQKEESDFDYKNASESDLDLYTKISDTKQDLQNLQSFNYEFIKKSLNEYHIDEAGEKYGFEVGTTFQTDEGLIYTINQLDEHNGFVNIISPWGNSNLSFSEFYEAFKKTKAKRTAKANNSEEFLSDLRSDSEIGSHWGDFESNDNGFYKRENKTGINYDYLVGKDSEDLIKIHSISGDKAEISFGEYNENKGKDKEKKSKKITFGVNKRKDTVSLGLLNTYIKEKKLVARSLDEEKDTQNIDTIEQKSHFFSKLFQNYSTAELIAGFKVGIEGIENFLKEGNDEHAAKFAQQIFGKFLPDEIKSDLTTRVETAGKKRMDDYIQKLKDIDSGPATEMIISWLKNKNAPQYKKEAGAIFMVEKYGVLYAKELTPFRGSFLWYESLGGKVNDTLYKDIEQQAKDEGVPFSEERLVYVLLVMQCKTTPHKRYGYPGGIKRRSRLHKEFKKHRAVGKEEEFNTGVGDGSDERSLEARVEAGIGEMEGGTYPNAIGFLESVVDKGGDLGLMNQIPFMMHFSGMIDGFDKIKTLDLLKNFPAKGRLLMTMRLMSNNADIKILNDAALEVCKRLSEEKKDPNILKEAKEVFNIFKGTSCKNNDEYKKKFKKVKEFYKNHGELITKTLYMVNDGSTSSDSRFNKMILLEKDHVKDKDGNIIREGNDKFKKYYKKIKGYTDEAEFNKDEFMADAFVGTGISGLNINKVSRQVLTFSQGARLSHEKIHNFIWPEILNEFRAISKRKYDGSDDGENKKIQIKLIKDMLRGLLSGFLTNHGSSPNLLKSYNSSTGPFSQLNNWGIDMMEFKNKKVNDSSLEDGSSIEGEKLLNRFSEQLLEHELTGRNFSSEVGQGIKNVRDAVGGTLDTENI